MKKNIIIVVVIVLCIIGVCALCFSSFGPLLLPPLHQEPKLVKPYFVLDEEQLKGVSFQVLRDSNNNMWLSVNNSCRSPAHYKLHISIFCDNKKGLFEKGERDLQGRVYPNGGKELRLGRASGDIRAKMSNVDIISD